MILLFVLGICLVLGAIIIVAVTMAESDGPTGGADRSLAMIEAMTNAPKELTEDFDKPFAERVIAPLQGRVLGLGKRVTGADASTRYQRKLDGAGNPAGWTVDRVIAAKVLGTALGVLFAGLVIALLGPSPKTIILCLTIFGLAGYFAPNFYLYQTTYDRAARVSRELPDAIDLMTISVESGLGFDAAIQQVANNTEGPLADELSRVLREMQIGSSRSDALRNLGERTTVPEVQTFVSAMVQADAFGIPIAQVLRVQSSEIRVKRRQKAEEKAQQVPVKIMIPLIFLILPCLFIPVMGPAVINIMDSFSGR
jgi:tight adherence protein C